MSTKTISTKSNQRKLCPVCKDAGKTEKEYTSHFVRDKPGPNGITICPLLLSLNCRKCGKKGHTFKYCKVNTEKKKETKSTTIVQEKSVQKGKFELLAESSDDEEGEEKDKQEQDKQEQKQEQVVTKQMTYADKLKEKQLPLAPTLPDLFVLRSTIPLAPNLPDLSVLRTAPALPEQKLPRAPLLPLTEEEKEKNQKLKDGCRKIISQKSYWADSDADSDSEDED